jgi:hypothetical protein
MGQRGTLANTTYRTVVIAGQFRCKETFECGKVALLGGRDERFEKASLLGRTHTRATPLRDMSTSSGHQVARVRFLES